MSYLTTINPSIETRVLLPKTAGGPSKRNKGSRKEAKASPSKPNTEPVEKVFSVSPKKVTK